MIFSGLPFHTRELARMKAICEHVSQYGDAITERQSIGLMPKPLKFYEMILNCVASTRQILKANCTKIKGGVGGKVENQEPASGMCKMMERIK